MILFWMQKKKKFRAKNVTEHLILDLVLQFINMKNIFFK